MRKVPNLKLVYLKRGVQMTEREARSLIVVFLHKKYSPQTYYI